MPPIDELALDPERLFRAPSFRHPGTGRRYRVSQRHAYDPVSQNQLITMLFEEAANPAGPAERPRRGAKPGLR